MASVGDESTVLVVIRGDTASGKSTTAAALRERLGGKTALVEQDYYRWRLLNSGDKQARSIETIPIMDFTARVALDSGYNVILEGVLNRRDHGSWLGRLCAEHVGVSAFCQFDIGLSATLRRHEGRPAQGLFGADEIRSWYDGWQPLPFVNELRISETEAVDTTVERIVNHIAHPA